MSAIALRDVASPDVALPGGDHAQDHPHHLRPRPVHQDRTTALLVGVEKQQETEMTFLAEDLARQRWAQDLSYARTARLAGAIRRRRAAERSRARARRLVRLASAAARRSEQLASTGDLNLAR